MDSIGFSILKVTNPKGRFSVYVHLGDQMKKGVDREIQANNDALLHDVCF